MFERDCVLRLEGVIITHGHEDHPSLPLPLSLPPSYSHPRSQVVPALDPGCPIYTTSFVRRLVERRMTEFSLWNEDRFKLFEMRKPFTAGPFQ